MKKWCLFLSGYMAVCCLAACGAMEESPADPGVSLPSSSVEKEADPLASLYMQVLEDLWTTDSALNEDISVMGVDLSGTSLSEEDRAALAEDFGERHGVEVVRGTWQ